MEMRNTENWRNILGALLACTMVGGCALEDEAFYEGDDGVELEDIDTVSQDIKWAKNGHDYLFVSTPKTWTEAREICNRGDYELVAVKGQGEQDFIYKRVDFFGNGTWWNGFNDRISEGYWRWDSGALLGFTNWASGEPYTSDASRLDCAVDDAWSGRWYSTSCDERHRFVCERSTRRVNDGAFTFDVNNTNNATRNTRIYSIYLYEGMLLTLGTCGVKNSWRKGDTFLRVKDARGTQIAANDDACKGVSKSGVKRTYPRGSNISFVAPATGTYYIHAGCYSNNSCKGKVTFMRW